MVQPKCLARMGKWSPIFQNDERGSSLKCLALVGGQARKELCK